MIYELEFKDSALKEWQKLDETLRLQLKKKLTDALHNRSTTNIGLED